MDAISAINLALGVIIAIFILIIIAFWLNPPRDQAEIMDEAYAGFRGPPPGSKLW